MADTRSIMIAGSIVYIILGACLLFLPGLSLADVSKTIGFFCVVAGVFEVLWYFIRKSYLCPERFGFAVGMSFVLLGIFALARTDEFTRGFAQILALVMLFDGVVKMQFSMDLLRMKNTQWWIALVLSLVMASLALIILLNPFESQEQKQTYTYVVLLVDGVVNIIVLLYTMAQLKKFQENLYAEDLPDTVEE